MSQTLALITDSKIIPKYLVTPSVALFVMVITIIGGNAPLIIPLLKEFVGYDGDVFIDFTASSAYGTGELLFFSQLNDSSYCRAKQAMKAM